METGAHPSRLALDQHLLGPTVAADGIAEHLRSCPRCARRLDAMRSEDERFRAEHPPSLRLLEAAVEPRPASRPARRLTLLSLSAAGALAAASVVFVLVRAPAPGPVPPATRIKGGSILELRVQRGKETLPFAGQALRAGDVLAFRYSTRSSHLLLVSVEASGRVNVFLADAAGNASRAIKPGRQQVLSEGVELDASPEPERLLALFSDRPVAVSAVREAIAARLRQLAPAARRELELGELPVAAEQVSALIRKERP